MKKLEEQWREAFSRIANRREGDRREAYLTKDILRNRQKLTQGGRQKLVLDFGFQGEKRTYSLSELNKMAKAMDKADDRFARKVKGVPLPMLVKHSALHDRVAAKGIANATLYKFHGNLLYFRVSASGDTDNAPSHYQVKIRLEEWDSLIDKYEGSQYLFPAKEATKGNVSIDCNCGRHTYWFRYLAGIGGFAVTPPAEHVFPKIRNPKLKGACCKHTLKALMALQTPVVQQTVARMMKADAKHKGFYDPEDKNLSSRDLKRMEEAGTFETEKAFKQFKKAIQAFKKKSAQPEVKKKLAEYEKRNKKQMEQLAMKKQAAEAVAKAEIQKRKALETALKQQWLGTLKTFKLANMDMTKAIDSLATNTGTDKAILTSIAKDGGLL